MHFELSDYELERAMRKALVDKCRSCIYGKTYDYVEKEYTTKSGKVRKRGKSIDIVCPRCNGDYEEVLTDFGQYMVEFVKRWVK